MKVIKGYTLLEACLILLIIGILCLIGSPAYQQILEWHYSRVAQQSLWHTLEFSRNQAIYTHQVVILSPRGEWERGYEVSIRGKVIKSVGPIKGEGKILWRGSLSLPVLQFSPEGDTHYQYGSFYYVDKQGKYVWRLVVNQAGRVRLESNSA